MISTDGMLFLESGVDWITVTCSDQNKGRRLGSMVAQLVQQERRLGNELKPWNASGYYGFAAGSVQSGERNDGILVRLGSYMARQNWRKFYAQATNCSRIDTQFTVNIQRDIGPFISRLHKGLLRAKKSNRAVPMLSVYQQDEGAATIYVGSRSSDSFGRVYNKEAESKDEAYEKGVRWEVEWKGDRAGQVAEVLDRSDDDEWTSFDLTSNWFDVRGHSQVLALPGIYMNASVGKKLLASNLLSLHRKKADDERALRWIETSCRGTVDRLVAHGRLTETLKALGLDHVVQPNTNMDQ